MSGAKALTSIQNAVDARNSVTHNATIFANALMHAGTTRDTFLRENLEWLSRATNWAKFSATAGLGVIHKVSCSLVFAACLICLPGPYLGRLVFAKALSSARDRRKSLFGGRCSLCARLNSCQSWRNPSCPT